MKYRVAKVRDSGKVKIQNEKTWRGWGEEAEIWKVNNEKPTKKLNCFGMLGNT